MEEDGGGLTHAREFLFRMSSNGVVMLRADKGGKEASELVEAKIQSVNRGMKKIKLRDMFSPDVWLEEIYGRKDFSRSTRSILSNLIAGGYGTSQSLIRMSRRAGVESLGELDT